MRLIRKDGVVTNLRICFRVSLIVYRPKIPGVRPKSEYERRIGRSLGQVRQAEQKRPAIDRGPILIKIVEEETRKESQSRYRRNRLRLGSRCLNGANGI